MSDIPVGPLVDREQVPPWLRPITDDPYIVNEKVLGRGGNRARIAAAFRAQRRAAVLVLFSGAFDGDPLAPGGLPRTPTCCSWNGPRRCAPTAGRWRSPAAAAIPATTIRSAPRCGRRTKRPVWSVPA